MSIKRNLAKQFPIKIEFSVPDSFYRCSGDQRQSWVDPQAGPTSHHPPRTTRSKYYQMKKEKKKLVALAETHPSESTKLSKPKKDLMLCFVLKSINLNSKRHKLYDLYTLEDYHI